MIPVKTIFEQQKTRTRVEGRFHTVTGLMSGLTNVKFEGYEIHMGQSFSVDKQPSPLCKIDTIAGETADKQDGMFCENVYGTYIHGIFDQEEVSKSVVISLFKSKGLDYEQVTAMDMKAHKERQYDLLAQGMRESLDMDYIYKILEQGI